MYIFPEDRENTLVPGFQQLILKLKWSHATGLKLNWCALRRIHLLLRGTPHFRIVSLAHLFYLTFFTSLFLQLHFKQFKVNLVFGRDFNQQNKAEKLHPFSSRLHGKSWIQLRFRQLVDKLNYKPDSANCFFLEFMTNPIKVYDGL